MSLSDIILIERNPFQKVTYCTIPYIWQFQKDNTIVINRWLPQVRSGKSVSLQKETGGFFDATVLYPVCGDGYANLHVLKFIELYTKRMLSKTKQLVVISFQDGPRWSSLPCTFAHV